MKVVSSTHQHHPQIGEAETHAEPFGAASNVQKCVDTRYPKCFRGTTCLGNDKTVHLGTSRDFCV
jgi:hypothetical protein